MMDLLWMAYTLIDESFNFTNPFIWFVLFVSMVFYAGISYLTVKTVSLLWMAETLIDESFNPANSFYLILFILIHVLYPGISYV